MYVTRCVDGLSLLPLLLLSNIIYLSLFLLCICVRSYPYGYVGFGGEVLSNSKVYEEAHEDLRRKKGNGDGRRGPQEEEEGQQQQQAAVSLAAPPDLKVRKMKRERGGGLG